jgi:hypothetical protein
MLTVEVTQAAKRKFTLRFRFGGRLRVSVGQVQSHLLLAKVGARQARKFTVEGLPCHWHITQVEKGFPWPLTAGMSTCAVIHGPSTLPSRSPSHAEFPPSRRETWSCAVDARTEGDRR